MTNQAQTHAHYHSAPIVGYHRAPLSQKFGVPRQPNLVALESAIEMIAPFDTPAAFAGLEDFSHLWLTWQFHHNNIKNDAVKKDMLIHTGNTKATLDDEYEHQKSNLAEQPFRAQIRPPRLGGNQKIGVFASRSMYRPSRLGLSVVKLQRIEVVDGRIVLFISGADMIEGTPIIDIKPYIAYSDSIEQANSGFAMSAPSLLDVTITNLAFEQFTQLISTELSIKEHDSNSNQANHSIDSFYDVNFYDIQQRLVTSDIELIKQLIAQDPRPAYRTKERNTTFTMRYKSVDVSFSQINERQLQIATVLKVC